MRQEARHQPCLNTYIVYPRAKSPSSSQAAVAHYTRKFLGPRPSVGYQSCSDCQTQVCTVWHDNPWDPKIRCTICHMQLLREKQHESSSSLNAASRQRQRTMSVGTLVVSVIDFSSSKDGKKRLLFRCNAVPKIASDELETQEHVACEIKTHHTLWYSNFCNFIKNRVLIIFFR